MNHEQLNANIVKRRSAESSRGSTHPCNHRDTSQGRHLLLKKLTTELRTMVFIDVLEGWEKNRDMDQVFTGDDELPAVFQTCLEFKEQGIQNLLEQSQVVIRTGAIMKAFTAWLEKEKAHEHVRKLSSPNFHFYRAGGRIYATGGTYDQENGDVALMLSCPRLREVQLTIELTYNGAHGVMCQTASEMVKRYSLHKLLQLQALKNLHLHLTIWRGGARNIPAGGNVWVYGNAMARAL